MSQYIPFHSKSAPSVVQNWCHVLIFLIILKCTVSQKLKFWIFAQIICIIMLGWPIFCSYSAHRVFWCTEIFSKGLGILCISSVVTVYCIILIIYVCFSAFAHAYTYAYEALEAQRDTLQALELEIFMVMNQNVHAANFCPGLL